jgi:hypothetical protein
VIRRMRIWEETFCRWKKLYRGVAELSLDKHIP